MPSKSVRDMHDEFCLKSLLINVHRKLHSDHVAQMNELTIRIQQIAVNCQRPGITVPEQIEALGEVDAIQKRFDRASKLAVDCFKTTIDLVREAEALIHEIAEGQRDG